MASWCGFEGYSFQAGSLGRILVVLAISCTHERFPETCFQYHCWGLVPCQDSRSPFMALVFLFR